MMKLFILLTCTVTIFLVSCTQRTESNYESDFPDSLIFTLKAECIEINELLEPGFAVKTDDYLVLFGESGHKRDLFYVYSLDDMKFLYSFGLNGRAKNEFLLTSPVYNLKNNKFLVLDNLTRKLFTYELHPHKEELKDTYKMNVEPGQPIQSMVRINDSIYIFNIIDGDGAVAYSYSLSDNKIIDDLRFDAHLKKLLGEKYNPTLNSFNMSGGFDQNIYVAHEYINELSRVYFDSEWKFTDSSSVLKRDNFTPYSYDNFSDNIMYNGNIIYDEGYVAALRIGRPQWKMNPIINPFRKFDFDIELYDKNLSPVALLKFDQNIFRFELDIKRKYIYSWDMIDGFEHIHRYDISEIINAKKIQ